MPIYINPDISREQQRICICNNDYFKTKEENTFADINNSLLFLPNINLELKKAFSFSEHFC